MDLSREKEIAEVASGLSSNLLLCHRGTSNHSALVRCLEVFVCRADSSVFRMTFISALSIFVLACVSFQTPMSFGKVFLHAVPCRHADGLLDFSKKLWIPSESDADRVLSVVHGVADGTTWLAS